MRRIAAALAIVLGACATVQPSLQGTSWQLVKFQSGDDAVLRPQGTAKYTLAFNADGSLNAQIDCNRGRGTWMSTGKGDLAIGPMAVTRAACAAGPLHDHILKQLPHIRSYVLKDGRLYLSLMADGGIYELEPAR